ncbi:MAG: Calcium-binding EF-hand-containing protein [Caulobacteraceae bacterium]|nr:Calcium-binding EF-hand-containing protein [Caulobacteraceae bacterium]
MNVGSTSSATLLQQLQQSLFSNADANSDGNLSLSEFDSIGQNVQGGGNSPPSGTTDASSLLTASALTALLALQQQNQSSGTSQTAGASAPANGKPSLDERFANADTNGDGEISADELTAVMAKHAPPGAATASSDATDASAKVLAKLDTDGDGQISKSEFAAMKPHGGHHHHGPPPASDTTTTASSSDSSSKTFDPADTNKDGTVSAAELAASLTSSLAHAGADVSSDDLASLSKLLDQLSANSSSSPSGSTTSIAA